MDEDIEGLFLQHFYETLNFLWGFSSRKELIELTVIIREYLNTKDKYVLDKKMSSFLERKIKHEYAKF